MKLPKNKMEHPIKDKQFIVEHSMWIERIIWDIENKWIVKCSEFLTYKIDTENNYLPEFDIVLN